MAQSYRADIRLTPEENVARLIVMRYRLSPPVNVVELAGKWASIEEDAIPVLTDAVVLHHPYGDKQPRIILNTNSTNLESRRRFTIAHEIGHITIPWHGGSIACHVEEDHVSVSSEHHVSEVEADRFASELLMPTSWVEQVLQEEATIEKTFNRIVTDADVSVTAARIKLMNALPPGYACVEYDRRNLTILRTEASKGTSLGLYLKFSEQRDLAKITEKLDLHATDGCVISRGIYNLKFWRLECREEIPLIQDTRNSADILRSIIEDLFPDKDREYHNRSIFSINGHASRANTVVSSRESEVIFGTMHLVFSQDDVLDSQIIKTAMSHPKFELYMAVKSVEMSRSVRVKGARKK